MKKQYLECGRIVTVHGLGGELKVQPWSDSAQGLLQFKTFYLDSGKTPLAVTGSRVHKDMLLVQAQGITTREEALALRGKVLYIDRADETLEEGMYYVQDLIGLEVYDADSGQLYGTLTQVSQTGANDVYHIRFADGSEQLIPAIKEVVLSTDLEANRMEIRPLRGLFSE